MRPFVLVLAILAPAAAPLVARADDCAPVVDAFTRFADAPAVHEVVTSREETIEVVFLDGKMRMKHGGTWQTVPTDDDGEDIRKDMLDTLKDGLTGCREIGGDTLDGTAMTVYGYTPPPEEDGDAAGPQQIWIGADGLPYRMTGKVEDDTIDISLRYTDVVAPQ